MLMVRPRLRIGQEALVSKIDFFNFAGRWSVEKRVATEKRGNEPSGSG